MIPLVAPCYANGDGRVWSLTREDAVEEFEAAFAERVGVEHAVAVCSGTVALALAFDALDLGSVTVPSYGCTAFEVAAEMVGIEAAYVDSTFHVRSARGFQNRGADVLVHLFGYGTIPQCCAIEDFSLSLGAPIVLKGDLGVCSTHSSKMVSTVVGGVVFGNDADLMADVRERSTPFVMSSMQAALGVSQLRQLDSFIARRRELAAFYSSRFADAGIECPDPDCGSVFFRYIIGTEDPASAVGQLAMLGVEAGRGVYPPLHRLAGLPDDDYPGTVASVNRLLSVPVHPNITGAQAEFIADSVVKVCGR